MTKYRCRECGHSTDLLAELTRCCPNCGGDEVVHDLDPDQERLLARFHISNDEWTR